MCYQVFCLVIGSPRTQPQITRSSFSLCGMVESVASLTLFCGCRKQEAFCQMNALSDEGSGPLTLCSFVCEVCVKMCDPAKGASGQRTIAVLLPCLLDKGMMSPVTEVRALRFESADEMDMLDSHSSQPSSRNWISSKVKILEHVEKGVEENPLG